MRTLSFLSILIFVLATQSYGQTPSPEELGFSQTSSDGYNANKVTDRVLLGDFDRDGQLDNVVAMYDYGSNGARLHVFHLLTDRNSEYNVNKRIALYSKRSQGWWSNSSFNVASITGRMVVGDFDNDGFRDDVAALQEMNGGGARLIVWEGNTDHTFDDPVVYWEHSGFNATKSTKRFVCGDFDHDGKEDDIATMFTYQLSNGDWRTRIYVWESNGEEFSYAKRFEKDQFNANKVTGRVVCGDFDDDGYFDDLATFYDYGTGLSRIHKFEGNVAGSFTYKFNVWTGSGVDSEGFTDALDVGTFYTNKRNTSIVGFYAKENGGTKMYSWTWEGNSFTSRTPWEDDNYEQSKIKGRVIMANTHGYDWYQECLAFYDNSENEGGTRFHVWEVEDVNYEYSDYTMSVLGEDGLPWYRTSLNFRKGTGSVEAKDEVVEELIADGAEGISFYPNPTANHLSVDLDNEYESVTIELVNMVGQIIFTQNYNNTSKVNLSIEGEAGYYFLQVKNKEKVIATEKLIKW